MSFSGDTTDPTILYIFFHRGLSFFEFLFNLPPPDSIRKAFIVQRPHASICPGLLSIDVEELGMRGGWCDGSEPQVPHL